MRRLVIAALALGLAGCAGRAGQTAEHTAELAADTIPPNAVTVVAVGDIACSPGSTVTPVTCQQGATARLARALNPRWVIALGDEQYEDGRLADFRASYNATWGALKARTKPLPGNHEYHTAGASGYYAYFGRRAPGYYATTIGSWRVYLLNSNCDKIDCTRERTWLRQDLNSHPTRCSAIAMHHARFSSGAEHGSSPAMAGFWRIADNHGVDLVLAGHDHDYERFVRMDADGHRTRTGMASFVVGTGGKSFYPLGTRLPGSAYFQNTRFGVLKLWLGDGGYAWQYRTVGNGGAGDVRDSGDGSCA
jgi:hypothetical protein